MNRLRNLLTTIFLVFPQLVVATPMMSNPGGTDQIFVSSITNSAISGVTVNGCLYVMGSTFTACAGTAAIGQAPASNSMFKINNAASFGHDNGLVINSPNSNGNILDIDGTGAFGGFLNRSTSYSAFAGNLSIGNGVTNQAPSGGLWVSGNVAIGSGGNTKLHLSSGTLRIDGNVAAQLSVSSNTYLGTAPSTGVQLYRCSGGTFAGNIVYGPTGICTAGTAVSIGTFVP